LVNEKDHPNRYRGVFLSTVISLLISTPVAAAEYRCRHYCPYWNQCYSSCSWFYTEQELYERGMANAERNLDYNSQGGTRRPSAGACTRALEAGVENSVRWSYGCRD
jgi:hypothetical protein